MSSIFRAIGRAVIVAAIPAMFALTSCSSDDTGSAQAPETSTTSAPAGQSGDRSDCPERGTGSSPARFDASGGTYAAQALAVTRDRQLRFDVVQWLSGEEADEAYFRESGDRSGAPNDYFIANESNDVRTAAVSEEATILVLREDGYAGTLHEVPLEALPTDGFSRTFWLTFEDGSITGICQQYRP